MHRNKQTLPFDDLVGTREQRRWNGRLVRNVTDLPDYSGLILAARITLPHFSGVVVVLPFKCYPANLSPRGKHEDGSHLPLGGAPASTPDHWHRLLLRLQPNRPRCRRTPPSSLMLATRRIRTPEFEDGRS
jgi:hypothetical protein